jgi:RNA recognition motif-containing protein
MRIYVGSLASSVNDDALRAAFAAHGEVASANVITDRDTGASRGFGFVEMRDSESAKAAMQALDGSDLGGSFLKVNEARPRNEGGGGGGGNRGGGGGGGGYGGGGGRY